MLGRATPCFRRHLLHETHEPLPAPCDCPSCGGKVANLDETVSEVLEHVAANFRVIRHVRRKFACTPCDAIVQAPAPSRAGERAQ